MEFELFCHNFITSAPSRVTVRDCFTKKQDQERRKDLMHGNHLKISFPLYKRSEILIESVEHLARVLKEENFKDTWIYFRTVECHPTIDSLAIHFNKQSMPINVVFYQMTISIEHSFKIVGRFVDYMSFFTSTKYGVEKFEFFFVVSEKQFTGFHHAFDPTNEDDLYQKKRKQVKFFQEK